MPKNNVCAYRACGSVKSRDPDVTFHRFPIDAATRLIWIQRCKNEKLNSLTPAQLANNRICSRHFSPHDFQSYGQGKRKIKDFCIPNENTDEPAISDNPVAENRGATNTPAAASIDLPLQQADNSSFPPVTDNPAKSSTLDIKPNLQASRKKVISRVTPIQASQARLIKLLRNQIKIDNQKINRMEAAIRKNSNLVAFAKSAQSLHSSQQDFIQMQLDHQKKKPWSEAEKQLALALFYISPKAYNHLRDKMHFALPCVSLIRRWINELNLTTGISQGIFDKLATKVETMTADERECVLMWDEVSLKKLLEYDRKADQVEGFEDLGELGRTSNIADHALTFMLRGLKYSWKQPIAYCLAHSSVQNADLKKLILEIMDKVHSIGLVIRATVCDQGATNRTALTSLGVTMEKPFFLRQSRKIFFMFDVPHLIKSVRNNLVGEKVFIIDGDEVSWEPIKLLRNLERDRACKAAPKLTDRHINPNAFEKMTVSLATQVFSASVSAALNAGHLTGEIRHPHCAATANFCKRLNDLFDCLNSRRASDPNPLKRALSSRQPQVQEYLESSLAWIEKWRFKSGSASTLPCVSGLIMTVRSVLQLWDELRETGTSYFITSRVNQDPLENLFAILRGRGGNNSCPSAMTFRRNLQYAMTANLMKPSSSSNCETDDAVALLPMLSDRSQNEGLASGVTTDFRKEIDALVNVDSIVDYDISDNNEEIERNPDSGVEEISSFPEESDDWVQEAIDDFPIDESTVDSSQAHSSFDDETVHFRNAPDSAVHQEPIAGCSNDESVTDNRIEPEHNLESNLSLQSCTLENCAKNYVAGYLSFKCTAKFNCSNCRVHLIKDNQNYENISELLIFWRAYRCKENFELGQLKAPTEEFSKVVLTMYSVFTEVFSSEPHRVKLNKHLETCIHNTLSEKHADFWGIEGPCRNHRNYIVELFVRVHVFNKVKWISRDLRDRGKNLGTGKSAKVKKRVINYGAKPNAKLQKISHK